MTQVDLAQSRLFPGFPAWLRRRLRRVYMHFALGNGDKGMRVARSVYASLNDGDGRHLSQRHLELLGRAWLAIGPHVPEPPSHRVPCVVSVLAELELEDALLEGWMLSMLGDTLRRNAWVGDSEDLRALRLLMEDKRIRHYWEWLMEEIKMRGVPGDCVDGTWKRGVIASRVLIKLHSGCRLASLVRRVDAWEAWRASEETISQRVSRGDMGTLVAGIGSRNLDQVLRPLWIQCASW